MSAWIVTGGAGFIGCNFVRMALERSDANVVVIDKLTYAGSLESLEDVASDRRFHFVKADIADADAVGQIFREHRPCAVLNFAAETHVDRSIDGPADFVHTNVVGTFTLLEAARQHVAKLESAARERFRFLHVSTDEVYGSLGPTGAFRETTPYEPNSPYSASKAGVIALTKSLGKELAAHDIAVNCITPAAARTAIFDQMTDEHIDYMLSKVPRGRFVLVEEVAAMVAWLASADNSFTTGGVFDISGGRATY